MMRINKSIKTLAIALVLSQVVPVGVAKASSGVDIEVGGINFYATQANRVINSSGETGFVDDFSKSVIHSPSSNQRSWLDRFGQSAGKSVKNIALWAGSSSITQQMLPYLASYYLGYYGADPVRVGFTKLVSGAAGLAMGPIAGKITDLGVNSAFSILSYVFPRSKALVASTFLGPLAKTTVVNPLINNGPWVARTAYSGLQTATTSVWNYFSKPAATAPSTEDMPIKESAWSTPEVNKAMQELMTSRSIYLR